MKGPLDGIRVIDFTMRRFGTFSTIMPADTWAEVVKVESLGPGKAKYPQTPVGYSDTPLPTRKSTPQHGEDTESILIDLLGYTWDDIASLQHDGVILQKLLRSQRSGGLGHRLSGKQDFAGILDGLHQRRRVNADEHYAHQQHAQ